MSHPKRNQQTALLRYTSQDSQAAGRIPEFAQPFSAICSYYCAIGKPTLSDLNHLAHQNRICDTSTLKIPLSTDNKKAPEGAFLLFKQIPETGK